MGSRRACYALPGGRLCVKCYRSDAEIAEGLYNGSKELSASVGVTQTIGEYGCKKEDIEMLANKAMEDPCMPGNPREVSKEDFVKLYTEAMKR